MGRFVPWLFFMNSGRMGAECMLEMIQKIFPEPVRRIFPALEQMGTLEEIRVRAGQPFLFQAGETEYFLDEKHGKLTREHGLACVAKKRIWRR